MLRVPKPDARCPPCICRFPGEVAGVRHVNQTAYGRTLHTAYIGLQQCLCDPRHQERTYLITVMFDLQDLFYLHFCLNFLKFLLLFFYFCFYLINMKSYNHSNKSVNFINIFTAINC